MGHEIVYCARCQIRLSGTEFEHKKAFRVGFVVCCAKCLDATLAAAPPEAVEAFHKASAPTLRPISTARLRLPREAEPSRRGGSLVLAALAGALVVGGIAALVLRPAPPPPAVPAPPPTPAPPPIVKAPAPEPTPPKDTSAPDLWAGLERRALPLIAAEEFRAAAELFEAARGGNAAMDAAIDRRSAELRGKAEALFPAVQGVAAAEARVRRWGYPDLLERHRASLTAPAPPEPPKPPSPEAVAYAERWNAALRLAAQRRFDEAIAELEAAGRNDEAAADLALLREVKALRDDGLKAFAQRPVGAATTLRVWGPDGAPAERSGVVRRAGPARLELDAGDILFVEAGDLTARSLVALSPLAAERPRAVAFAALLDGEAPEGVDLLPPKYRALAASRPRPDPADLALRERFYEAERAFAREERRAESALLYRALLREHADAPLLREELPRIRERAELPKEIVFHATDLRPGGAFRFSPVEKAECAWVVAEGTSPEAAASNFVELAFAALPESSYRLWAYVGGCCAETFTFGTQADELLVPVRKGASESISAAPGATAWAPASHNILFLKRTHALHGGPREPKRWEWVSLPLPKFAAPGVKKLRIVSAQQGFAVAAAVLSAVRTAPPGDADTREILKKVALPSKPVDDALVGAWKMDEGRGRVAVDASGRGGHATVHGAEWRSVDGRAGLWFDGVDDAAIGPTRALDVVEDSFTIAFWARPEGDRTSTPEEAENATGTKEQRYAVFPSHGQDSGRAGVGVSIGRNGVSVFEHASGHMPSLLVHDAAISRWTHVALVVEKRQPKLYLDGVLVRTGLASRRPVFPGGQISSSDYGRYAGMLADLRIYKRALSEAELKKLR